MAVLQKISWSARVALLAPLLFAAACASGRNDRAESAEQVETPQAPARPPENDRPPFLSSRGGPPGTPVTVSMSGLVMNVRLDVGFGSFVENQIVRRAQADQDGAFADQKFHEDQRTASVRVDDGAVRVHASGGDPLGSTTSS